MLEKKFREKDDAGESHKIRIKVFNEFGNMKIIGDLNRHNFRGMMDRQGS